MEPQQLLLNALRQVLVQRLRDDVDMAEDFASEYHDPDNAIGANQLETYESYYSLLTNAPSGRSSLISNPTPQRRLNKLARSLAEFIIDEILSEGESTTTQLERDTLTLLFPIPIMGEPWGTIYLKSFKYP